MMIHLIFGIALAWVLGKLIKTVLDMHHRGRFVFRDVLRDGGMPSTHTILVTSLFVGLLFETGISYYSLIAAILAMIVINDAMGVRFITGEQSKVINELTKGRAHHITLQERVGHTPIEVAIGLLIGALVPALLYLIF